MRPRILLLVLLVGLVSLNVGIFAAHSRAEGGEVWILLVGLVAGYTLALLWIDRFVLRPVKRDLALARSNAEELRRTAIETADLYNRAPCAYHSLDEAGNFTRINDTALAWLGYAREELIGRPFLDLLAPRSRVPYLLRFPEVKTRGWVRDLELELIRKDGTLLFGLLSAVAIQDAGGFPFSRSAWLDITDHKKSVARTSELSNRLRTVLNAATEFAVIAYDLDGRIVLFNAGAERMLGYHAEEMIGREMPWSLHVPAEVLQAGARLQREHSRTFGGFDVLVERVRQGGHEERQWTYVCKDGSRLTVNLVMTGLRDNEGALTGYLGIATDVTERVLSRERLNMTMAAARIGVWEWDIRRDQTSWSSNISEILGEPIGAEKAGEQEEGQLPVRTFQDFLALIAPQDRERVRQELHEVVQLPEASRYQSQFQVSRPDEKNGARWVEFSGQVFRDEDGVPLRVMGTMMDVTERRLADAALRAARDAAESANRAKTAFLASLSHEIRNPLGGIIGMAEVLLQSALPEQSTSATLAAWLEEQRGRVRVLAKSAETLSELINDVLDLSKVEAGKLELENEPFSPAELITDTISLLTLQAQRKGILLRAVIASGIAPLVRGDKGRLRQVLLNLAGNAVKFTEQGEVVVSLTNGSRAENLANLFFEVRDSGIGIPPDKLDSIFEPFVQAGASTARTHGGSGLGLAIASHLVERMGGRLAVTSELGRGSTFSFNLALPLAVLDSPPPEERESVAQPAAAVSLSPDVEPSQPPLLVLVVEDNLVNQEVFTLMLRSAGHSVEVVNNGMEALAAFERSAPDIILMDLQMPEMDGLRATRLLRAREKALSRKGGRVPIVAVTANALQGERQRCLSAGMDDYLSKPIRGPELLRVIQKLTGRGQGATHENTNLDVSADWMAPLVKLGFDREAARKLARTFLETAPMRLSLLEEGVAEGDAERVQAAAHTLKSSVGVFSARRAMEAAATLEAKARERQLEGTTEALNELRRGMEELKQLLETFLVE